MKLVEILFSPTGGTKKVCEIISGEFHGKKTKIDLMNAEKVNDYDEIMPEDICLIAVPSFEGRVPAPAAERLQKVKGM